MNVLVACEFSGIVRDAFRALGHNAYSCDLLPSEADPTYHIQRDAIDVATMFGFCWDLLIAHPPCTHLASSGARWWSERKHEQEAAIDFVKRLASLPIERIAIENPIGKLSSAWRKPDQIIQPWQFGHGETKATCLWLKNLPPLKPTCIVDGREPRIHFMPPGPDRWRERSRTFTGIAKAMAEQWGGRTEFCESHPCEHGNKPTDCDYCGTPEQMCRGNCPCSRYSPKCTQPASASEEESDV